jgi:alpha-amylase/alpha-mannosidase (GH57 family)
MAAPRYVCIHGHFYQPPRENPWLEAVEVQDSAGPYHDWNERITRECYAPNACSRLVDGQGRIVNLINNYAWMSFNFGPTLLAWLADNAPEVLAGIVEGDRLSRERHQGHGNALAQAYNHVILPLTAERDRKTQIAWGIADFRHRFGREPEGMWLPETAVDAASLEALAAAGIRFTILAPRQARRWRKLGEEEWTDNGGAIDPSRAYQCNLPSGRSIAVFFYDGNVSQQVAFERLLDSGEQFLARLEQGFSDERGHPELMHIATDGESYGHHHTFGDMALAFVLDRLRQHPDLRITNYGEFLEMHPPEWEVEIHENSSWSCTHGVERWRSNCGCKTRWEWQQEWRGPLRRAMEFLKGRIDQLYVSRGRGCFKDVWAARDGYVRVVLDRDEAVARAFFRQFGHPDLDNATLLEGLWLLEMQRHALLMFTSCGWFFDEISGLETAQCLRYAARAIQLAAHFGRDLEPEFVALLQEAPSNVPQYRDGKGVWEQLIRPGRIDLDRVLAHHAISLIFRRREPRARVYCYDLEVLDHEVHTRGSNHVAVGRMHVRSRMTWHEAETTFAVLHYGGLDFFTVLRKTDGSQAYDAFKKRLLDTYRSHSLADVTTLLVKEFNGHVHRLDDLFDEEQRRVIGIALQDRFRDYQATFERLADQDQDLLNRLGQLHFPLPKPMRAAASAFLDHHLRTEIVALAGGGSLQRVRLLYERGLAWGYQPERDVLGRNVSNLLQQVLIEMHPTSDLPEAVARAGILLDAANLLGVTVDLWQAQNRLLDACARLQAADALPNGLRDLFGTLAIKMNLSPTLLGQRF